MPDEEGARDGPDEERLVGDYIAKNEGDDEPWVDETADRTTYAFEMATDGESRTVEISSPADEEPSASSVG